MNQNANKIEYFLYARKSSESEDRQIQSIDDQINRLKKLAYENGYSIKEILTESHSAKSPGKRAVFNKMLDRIERGEANGILCWQINRLSRNPIDSARIQWLLQQGVIQSIQTMDGERKPSDNAVLLSVESGVSNQFILDHMKNVRRGLESKLEKGWIPCRARLGYLNEPYERTIVPDPERFHLVRKMFDFMLTGNYLPSKILNIANNEWGFRSRKTRKQGNQPLSMGSLYKMFHSQFYCGIIEYGGKQYPGKHKPMITIEEYDRIQMLLGSEGRPRPQKHEHAFTGIIHCNECGCLYTAYTKTKLIKATGKMKSFTYYRCTRKKVDVKCTRSKQITKDDLELQIEKELEKYELLPEFLESALEGLNASADKDTQEEKMLYESQQKTLNETHKQLDNLTKMRYRDLIDDSMFLKEKNELQKKISILEEKINRSDKRVETSLELTKQSFRFAAYARKSFLNGSLQAKREILSAFGSNPMIDSKILLIRAMEWLVMIKNAYEPLKEKYTRLELDKKPLNKWQNDALLSIRAQWCSTVEDVRTYFIDEKDEVNIPDVAI